VTRRNDPEREGRERKDTTRKVRGRGSSAGAESQETATDRPLSFTVKKDLIQHGERLEESRQKNEKRNSFPGMEGK